MKAQERRNVDVEAAGKRSVTFRSVFMGCVLLVLLNLVNQRAEFVGNWSIYLDVAIIPSTAGIAGIFLLMAINAILRRFKIGTAFSQQEMAVVYIMLTVGGLFAALGVVGFSVGNMAAAGILHLSDGGDYTEIFHRLSSWVTIKSDEAIVGFWLGSDSGVPWGDWIVPICMWTLFFGVVFWVMICLGTVVRRHWTDRERLQFVLVSPVSSLIREDGQEGAQSFWKNKYTLIGMLIPFVIFTTHIINNYYKGFPAFPIYINLGQYFADGPASVLAGWPGFTLYYRPLPVGVAYLVNLEVSFSLWFFYLLDRFTEVMLNAAGRTYIYESRFNLGRGATLGIALFTLWLVRNDLRIIVARAFGRGRTAVDDSNEPMSYAASFWGIVLGLVFIVLYTKIFLGMSVYATLAFFFVFFGVSLGFARVKAEAGYPYTVPPMEFTAGTLYQALGGSAMLTKYDMFGFAPWFNPLHTGYAGSGTSLALEAYKLGDDVELKRRDVTWVLMIAFVVAVVVGYLVVLPFVYRMGLFNLHEHRMHHGQYNFVTATFRTTVGTETRVAYGVGAVIAVFLMYMRSHFIWWPLNPLGFAIASNTWMAHFWGEFFIAWLIKAIMYRYGGVATYRKSVPFFMGMIIGQVIMSIISVIINAIYMLVAL